MILNIMQLMYNYILLQALRYIFPPFPDYNYLCLYNSSCNCYVKLKIDDNETSSICIATDFAIHEFIIDYEDKFIPNRIFYFSNYIRMEVHSKSISFCYSDNVTVTFSSDDDNIDEWKIFKKRVSSSMYELDEEINPSCSDSKDLIRYYKYQLPVHQYFRENNVLNELLELLQLSNLKYHNEQNTVNICPENTVDVY